MKRKKKFDCVKMKWAIQKRIRRQLSGMSPEEARRARQNRIEQDPLLGPFLKQVRVIGEPAHR
jgi:hypothetical protein